MLPVAGVKLLVGRALRDGADPEKRPEPVRGAISIHGKLGTHPADWFYVKGGEYDGTLFDLDTPPSEGDRVFVKSERDQRCRNYTQVIVNDINEVEGQLFFMELA